MVGICKFVAYAKDNLLFANEDFIYNLLESIDFSYKNPDWIEYGAMKGVNNNIVISSSSTGTRMVFKYLIDQSEIFNQRKEKEYIKNA
jgi:hypothetical protein